MNPSLRVHTLLHVPFEGIGCIADWIAKNNFSQTETRLWENANLPALEHFDLLVIMGGPMSVDDEKKFHWLHHEKIFIEETINQGKQVLGICLGSQLIANADNTLLHFFPKEFITFHWHGDTFDLPQGATHVAQSEACLHQAFTYGDNVVALQFHPEMTQASMREMLKEGDAELVPAMYVQPAEEILAQLHYADAQNELLNQMLDKMAANFYRQQLLHVL